jgi:hypothetical protein
LNGRLQRIAQRLTALIALFPAALTAGGNFKAAILEALPAGANLLGLVGIDQTTPGTTDSVTVKAADGIGSLTEAAPATDTASSGLNGRLQRVAQNITALIGLFPAALTSGGNFKTAIQEALPAGTNLIGKIAEQTLNIVSVGGIVVGATSTSSLAVGATTSRIVLIAKTSCWVSIGNNPTAESQAAGSFPLSAGSQSYPIAVTPGVSKIAAIQDSEAGYLSIIESE